MDKREIEEKIIENSQRLSDTINEVIKINTTVFGVRGDNGINGRQKEMETEISDLKEAVTSISANFKNMNTKIDNMEKSARFWTRTIGVAVLIQVVTIMFSLIQTHPIK